MTNALSLSPVAKPVSGGHVLIAGKKAVEGRIVTKRIVQRGAETKR